MVRMSHDAPSFKLKFTFYGNQEEEIGRQKGGKKKLNKILSSKALYLWPKLQFIYTDDFGWHRGQWLFKYI